MKSAHDQKSDFSQSKIHWLVTACKMCRINIFLITYLASKFNIFKAKLARCNIYLMPSHMTCFGKCEKLYWDETDMII